MKSDTVVLYSAAPVMAKAAKRADASRRQNGSCEIVLVSSLVSGCGVTTFGRQIATLHDWPFISCNCEMTVRALLNLLYEAIVRGGVGNFYQNFECFNAIVRELRDLGAPPLIIDDCFRLSPRLIDVLRDCGDASGAPLIFLCTRELRHTLVAPKSCSMEAVTSRVVADIELPKLSIRDAQLFASELAEVEIDARLIGHIFKTAGGSARSLLRAYTQVEEVAAAAGLDRIGLAEWLSLTGQTLQPDRIAPPATKTIAKAASDEGKEPINQAAIKGAVKAA